MTPAEAVRPDFELISGLVTDGARVLDLGCGDGSLLQLVRDEKGALVHGVELDFENVAACVRHDIPVLRLDLDQGLAGFPDHSFDIVILSQTLQVVRKPAFVLREMLRVADRGIISFPNFGYWRTRLFLALRGRMPVNPSIPYTWYETPNIHHTTIHDFRDFVAANGGTIEREMPLVSGSSGSARPVGFAPNLLADTAVAVVRRA